MSGLLTPERRETMLGNAQILEIFLVSKVGKIAGCRVTDGKVERGANVRLIRDNVVIHEGKLSQLKRFKDDAREVVVRPGMRHGVRELPGHARRRRDRVLSRGVGAAVALSPIASWPGFHSASSHGSLSGNSFKDDDGCPAQAPGMTKELQANLFMPRHHQRDHATGWPSQRQLRVGELIRHALAEMLSRGEVHDPVIEAH